MLQLVPSGSRIPHTWLCRSSPRASGVVVKEEDSGSEGPRFDSRHLHFRHPTPQVRIPWKSTEPRGHSARREGNPGDGAAGGALPPTKKWSESPSHATTRSRYGVVRFCSVVSCGVFAHESCRGGAWTTLVRRSNCTDGHSHGVSAQ